MVEYAMELDKDIYNRLYNLTNNYGYTIPIISPTKPLYRYRGNIDYAVDEILDSYIYLEDVEKLNDPFDSSYFVPFEKAKREKQLGKLLLMGCIFIKDNPYYQKIEEQMEKNGMYEDYIVTEDFFAFLEEEIKKYGLNYSANLMMKFYYENVFSSIHHNFGYSASFSERHDSILMWSYYSNSHKGVCLEYDLSSVDGNTEEEKSILRSLKKVWYSSERYEDREGKFTPFVKAQEWAHEQEWRLYNRSSGGKVYFPYLKAVYLGMNLPIYSDEAEKIINAIKENGSNITLYKCYPDHNTYQIKENKIILRK